LAGKPRDWLNPRKKRLWLVVAILFYTLGGFFLAPWIAERQLVSIVGDLLHRPVQIEKIRINPYVLSAEASGFSVTETDGSPLLGFDRLYLNFQLSSLVRWAWSFREISLDGLHGELVRKRDGTINLLELIPPAQQTEPPAEQVSMPRFFISVLELNNAELGVTDHSRTSGFATRLTPVSLRLENITSIPDKRGRLDFSADSADGVELQWQGEVQLEPLLLTGSVTAKGAYIPLLHRYFRDSVKVDVPQGELSVSFDYRVASRAEGLSAEVDNLMLAIEGLAVTDSSANSILDLPRLSLKDGYLRWPEQQAGASTLTLTRPQLWISLQQDKTLNLQHLLVDTGSSTAAVADPAAAPDNVTDAETTATTATSTTATSAATTSTAATSTSPATASDGPDWEVKLAKASVESLQLTFEDRSLNSPDPIVVEELNLQLENLSNQPAARFPLTLRAGLASGGNLTLDGDFSILPALDLKAAVAVSNLALAAAQPYVSDYIAADIVDGKLNVSADIVTTPDERFAIEGKLSIDQLDMIGSSRQRPLLSWQQASLDHFRYTLSGNRLDVSSLLMDAPYVKVHISADGSNNFQRLMTKAQSSEAPVPSTVEKKEHSAVSGIDAAAPVAEKALVDDRATTPFSFALDQTIISDGSADFSDRSLPIPFKARIVNLKGDVTTIDSTSTEPAAIKIEGQVNDYGMARIEGSLQPLGPTENTDISILFRNVEVPDLTPYTVKLAGRAIASGRMDLDLHYRIEAGNLQGKNNVVITDLTLGDKVDYENALDLPLGLAVSLLKGPDGKIRVDLPVEGNINNPSFRIGGVIRAAFANLISGIVTAPFRFLASLVGADSEDFDRIEFEPGLAVLMPPEREKLHNLAQALSQRPQLALDVPGVVAVEADRQALQKIQVEALIAANLAENAESAANNTGLRERRTAILETLFQARYPESPLTAIQQPFMKPVDPQQAEGRQALDQIAYSAELRRQVIAAEAVSEEDLEQLAMARADAVLTALTTDESIAPERISTSLGKPVKIGDARWVSLKLAVESRQSGR